MSKDLRTRTVFISKADSSSDNQYHSLAASENSTPHQREPGMLALPLKLFFLPGDLVSNFLGVVRMDDRGMVRTMINMLFWNAIAAGVVLYLV
jgi:hypothetical protein